MPGEQITVPFLGGPANGYWWYQEEPLMGNVYMPSPRNDPELYRLQYLALFGRRVPVYVHDSVKLDGMNELAAPVVLSPAFRVLWERAG